MNDEKFLKLIFTALTPVFWSIYSIQGVKAYQGISLFRQSDMLTQVDHIEHACTDDEAELTVLSVVDRVGFVGENTTFLIANTTAWHYFNNPR